MRNRLFVSVAPHAESGLMAGIARGAVFLDDQFVILAPGGRAMRVRQVFVVATRTELLRMARHASSAVLFGFRFVTLKPIGRMMLVTLMAIAAEAAIVALVAHFGVMFDGYWMLFDPIGCMRLLDGVAFIAEGRPLSSGMTCLTTGRILFVSGRMGLYPTGNVRLS
jgi:hypothetical protein